MRSLKRLSETRRTFIGLLCLFYFDHIAHSFFGESTPVRSGVQSQGDHKIVYLKLMNYRYD